MHQLEKTGRRRGTMYIFCNNMSFRDLDGNFKEYLKTKGTLPRAYEIGQW